ncbi:MAG TPA: hypothetical protein VM434_16705, partial [Beijerinckiaceae bacterium]|nr:hypothetical protein [Beijerinckiaceae bacterium]
MRRVVVTGMGIVSSIGNNTQGGEHLLRVVADRRDDAHPGDDDAPHAKLPWPVRTEVRRLGPGLNRPGG